MGRVISLETKINELNKLLGMVAENIDLHHCKDVDDRYIRSLLYEAVDRPPLVIQAPFGFDVISLPEPWCNFRRYSYKETFEDPAAMLQNQILNMIVPGLLLKDDNPLAIRNNHGTIQIASILGGKWSLYQNNSPWVAHMESLEDVEKIVGKYRGVDYNAGIFKQSIETLEFYLDKLREFPPCMDAIQVSVPDLEGPMNTAEQLWGSDIYYSFYDHPKLLEKLLGVVTDAMLEVFSHYKKFSTDRLYPEASTQHFYQIPGSLLIRDDSSIMLSPAMYEEFISPFDAIILKSIGGGSIHFCGNGMHLIDKMINIPNLKGFDLGQPEYMNIHSVYAKCKSCKIALTHITPKREDLISGKAIVDFPTGVVFVYYTNNIDDAYEVVKAYKERVTQ